MHAILHLASCVLLVGVEIEMKRKPDRDEGEIEDHEAYRQAATSNKRNVTNGVNREVRRSGMWCLATASCF